MGVIKGAKGNLATFLCDKFKKAGMENEEIMR
jgi:hypothetical protein